MSRVVSVLNLFLVVCFVVGCESRPPGAQNAACKAGKPVLFADVHRRNDKELVAYVVLVNLSQKDVLWDRFRECELTVTDREGRTVPVTPKGRRVLLPREMGSAMWLPLAPGAAKAWEYNLRVLFKIDKGPNRLQAGCVINYGEQRILSKPQAFISTEGTNDATTHE